MSIIDPVRFYLHDQLGLRVYKRRHSRLDVESFIGTVFGRRHDVRFIQCGAHNATANDPLRPFWSHCPWKGVLIEANPIVFEELKKSLGGQTRVQGRHIALTENVGEVSFYIVNHPNATKRPIYAGQISSLAQARVIEELQSWGHSQEEAKRFVTERRVPGENFEHLFGRLGWRPDLLFMDLEGYDYKILKTYPFDLHKPEMIVFEHNHLSPDEMAASERLLIESGYHFFTLKEDVVAWRVKPLGQSYETAGEKQAS